jgi:hypothetical protein
LPGQPGEAIKIERRWVLIESDPSTSGRLDEGVTGQGWYGALFGRTRKEVFL